MPVANKVPCPRAKFAQLLSEGVKICGDENALVRIRYIIPYHSPDNSCAPFPNHTRDSSALRFAESNCIPASVFAVPLSGRNANSPSQLIGEYQRALRPSPTAYRRTLRPAASRGEKMSFSNRHFLPTAVNHENPVGAALHAGPEAGRQHIQGRPDLLILSNSARFVPFLEMPRLRREAR